MSDKDDFEPLTNRGYLAGVLGVVVLAVGLFFIGKGNVNVWFFFVSTFGAYLVADLFSILTDKVASVTRRQVFIFHKFLGFALSILAGAVAGEYLYGAMLGELTNTPLIIGVTAVLAFTVLIPSVLLGDFFLRGNYRFLKTSQTKMIDILMSKETLALLEMERKKRMLRSIPETIRVILSEHLSKD